jgi:putative SOS response-associated peptidase YedK
MARSRLTGDFITVYIPSVMCGRFVRISPVPVIAKRFQAEASTDAKPSYNIAPGQDVIMVASTDRKKLFLSRWGFLPSWAKDPSMGTRMINARSETASVKPAFRHALRHHRCLIVADGFYEWEERAGKKYPFYIHTAGRGPFGFAGLFNLWESSQGDTIITYHTP